MHSVIVEAGKEPVHGRKLPIDGAASEKAGTAQSDPFFRKAVRLRHGRVSCSEAVQQIQDPNVTELARTLRLTKGAISKTVRKLQAQKPVESHKREDNRQKSLLRCDREG